LNEERTMMKLRFAEDDRVMRGATALDCLRCHCQGDHSAEAQRGDIDGVMKRLAATFQLDPSYVAPTTLEERAAAFVTIALACGLLVDLSVSKGEVA
jgi:hypothetical protein